MRSRALLVPRARGEELRRALAAGGLLRTDLPILREGDSLALPLTEGRDPPAGLGEIVEREFAVRGPVAPADYRSLLDLPPDEAERLPRSFDVIGDVVLVRIPDDLASRAPEIGRALLEFVPGARIVGSDEGVHGPDRRRTIRRLAGSGGWRTRHRENGIQIEVDVELAYFSPRLAREHARVAAAVLPGDRVYDLCCGVGPFALTIAKEARAIHVTAVDSNPHALELLRRSLARAAFSVPVDVVEGRVEEFARAAPPVERVILNLPLEGIKYLPSVARTVARRGHLHYYEVVPRDQLEGRGEAVVHAIGSPGEWRELEEHVVHPYSPMADLVGFELERTDLPTEDA